MNYESLISKIIADNKDIIIVRVTRTSFANIMYKIVGLEDVFYDDPDAEGCFTLLHEIGHIRNNKPGMKRSEEEYYATVWAIKEMLKYKFKVSDEVKNIYQKYIYSLRRKNGLTREQLTLQW